MATDRIVTKGLSARLAGWPGWLGFSGVLGRAGWLGLVLLPCLHARAARLSAACLFVIVELAKCAEAIIDGSKGAPNVNRISTRGAQLGRAKRGPVARSATAARSAAGAVRRQGAEGDPRASRGPQTKAGMRLD